MPIQTETEQTERIVVLADGRMDRKNAAKYVGLSEKTLAQYASQGTGPKFIKRGRVWYRKADLDEWLDGGAASSTAQARHFASIVTDDARVRLVNSALATDPAKDRAEPKPERGTKRSRKPVVETA
ncbi:helix-turn-helix transcriptional regulator [Burkholderia pseudomallei]|uniref:helix-turn-helix transcriptional regulator n=1 Tax=Burkholderia pseudomallei TaxID=28450 RepID=UPI000F12B479|nr:helix-turn-helix domain-containing protein [Burkholderia pseudomallei]CAJ4869443.1 Helix-turn-helix domain [Burkholderia pseudomallei]CAJ5296914.1 Helix-turn-helix domain [Burkholderia pseudomallei]CAJ5392937.1 Helix-turn-helix domain [Burkholderia pseudomallei]CAJ7342530.1 Helix-turn-helix domain [Burkholderia pseudomallei]VBJ69328.1 Helix-turn-helix domain [Burkholderia pseudomallei]